MAREREAGIPRIPGTYEASPPSPAPLPAQTVPRLPAPPRRASSLCSETPAPACDRAGTCQHREDGGMDPARRSLTPTVETRARAPRPAPKGAAARRVLSCASQACGSWFAPGAFPGTRRSGLTSCSLRSQATRVSETFVLFPTQRVNVLALGVPKTLMCQRIKSVKGKATAASPGRGQERWAWKVLSLRVLVCLHVHASFVCMRPFAYMCPFE